MRKNGSNRLTIYAAGLIAVFSLAFFLGRNTVPYETAVSVQRPWKAEAPAPEAAPEAAVRQSSAPAERAAPDLQGPLTVDLNRATAEELTGLPGIGETLAKRIIAYRTEVGPFYAPEQIMDVEGIGEGIYEKLCDAITVTLEEP